jgi:hypothetical protein
MRTSLRADERKQIIDPLLRSATRVEQVMETASQDRKFADAWSSIQANLRGIKLDESFSVR